MNVFCPPNFLCFSLYPVYIMKENTKTGIQLFIFRGYHRLQMYVVLHYYGSSGMMRDIKERIPCFYSVFIHLFHKTFLSALLQYSTFRGRYCVYNIYSLVFFPKILNRKSMEISEYKYNKKTLQDYTYLDHCVFSPRFSKCYNGKVTRTAEQH